MDIMYFKHKLSLEFSLYDDWNILINELARIPSTIAQVKKSNLFVFNQFFQKFELTAQWPAIAKDGLEFWSSEHLQIELENQPICNKSFFQWQPVTKGKETFPNSQIYCLQIQYRNDLIGIIQFELKEGQDLSDDQYNLFSNINEELGIFLHAGQERKKKIEMLKLEATLTERRRISQYLHDHLGHNLGYIHFKLDQLVSKRNQLSFETLMADLEQMSTAAQESYHVVRNTLETMRLETTPLLSNLLIEHARKISKRSNIEIEFKTKGNPVHLPIDVNRAVFYVFEEALCNTEKYAHASKVDILAEWREDDFFLTISDNGIGFNPQEVNVDEHFGLEILNERMDRVNGQISLSTSKDSGTTVFVRVPNSSYSHQEGAND